MIEIKLIDLKSITKLIFLLELGNKMTYRFVNSIRGFSHRLSSVSLPERLRGGSIERAVEYLKQVAIDYKQVFIDTTKQCRDRPLKATFYGSLLASVVYCMATNPDEHDLEQQLLESHNNLSSVPQSIQNTDSCDYVLKLNELKNQKLLNYQSLGLFSVLYLSDWPKSCCLYVNQCQYIRPKLSSYLDRIVDIGFVNKFRLLDTKMIDYDVNHNEWQQKSG